MKNQLKKSLSLVMAVLMVLSCWVWVAPTKAEAAGTQYYVEVRAVGIRDTGNATSNKIEVKYRLKNGYDNVDQTPGQITLNNKLFGSDNTSVGGTVTVWSGNLDGFPVSAAHYAKSSTGTFGYDALGIYVRDTSGNMVLVSSTDGCSWSVTSNEHTVTVTAKEEKMPYPNTMEGLGGDIEMTIPDIYTSKDVEVSSKESYSASAVDQYGVYWAQEPTYFLSQSEKGSPDQDMSDKASGLWVETAVSGGVTKATVKINSLMQTVYSQKSGFTKDYYLIAYSEGNEHFASAAKKITFHYPPYSWKFDAKINGSTDDLSIIVEEIDENGNITSETYGGNKDESGNQLPFDGTFYKPAYLAYNQKASLYPVSAERPGFTFLGFWTAPQPTEGKSSAYAKEDEFKSPVSTDEYNAMSPADKEFYTPAGTKWSHKGETALTTGNKEYYAWFLSNDVTVKFYDIDGKYLNTAETKAGKDNTSINWATPKNDYKTEGDSYDSGYIKYSNWTGMWKSTKGEIVNPNGYVFSEDLMLIPEFSKVELSKTYPVKVYDHQGEWTAYTKNYTYRDVIGLPDGSTVLANGKTLLQNLTDNEDKGYTYEYVGWSTETPSTGKTYHMLQEGMDVDVNGNTVTIAVDDVVRSESSFYPVFRRTAKEYTVTFRYYNELAIRTDTKITYKYGDLIVIPEEVPASYALNGIEKTVLGWSKDGAEVTIGEEVCSGETMYESIYDAGVPADYRVTFEFRNAAGKIDSRVVYVEHGEYLTAEDLDVIMELPSDTYDDGTNENYYKGLWEYNNRKDYTKTSLLNLRIRNHITIKAVYEDGVPFRTVTYVDGVNTQAFRITEGTPITPWTVTVDGQVKDYIPVKAKDEHGVYEFAGWFDEEQTSADFSITNGTKYNVGTDAIGSADLTLYPQFTYNKYNYNYKFYDADGTTELYSAVLHYGDGFAVTKAEAESAGNAAAAKKTAADNTYEYMFVGWDKKLPDFCEGDEPDSTVEFVAQFRKYYKYYTVEWFGGYVDGQYVNYNEDGAAVIDGKPFATGKYIYDAKIFTPSESFNAPAPNAEMQGKNQNYAFSKWCYIDENGEVKDYTRDLRIKNNMKFFATYEPTDIIRTVTVVVDEKTTYTVDVKDGATLEGLVSEPIAGYKNETYHHEFVRWYTENNETIYVEPADGNDATAVTANITIYAQFVEGTHEYTLKEITKAPTFPVKEVQDEDGNVVVPASDGKGEYIEWCECSKEKTWRTAEAKIDALVDTIEPAGTAYVGTKWNGADGTGADAVLASPSTDLIITTTDKAEANQVPAGFDAEIYKYNTAGQGIGVETIKLTIKNTDGSAVVTDETVYSWAEIQKSLASHYETWDKVPEIYKHYNANATAKLSKFDLKNGETYVATYTITDINGNEKTVTTVPFTYDNVAPVITVADKNTLDNEKFCGEVEFTVTDTNVVTVTAGGHTLNQLQGVYKIAEAGYYNVVAVDEAGNKSSTYVQVIKSDDDIIHTFKPYRVDATCEAAGYETRKCEICGFEDVKTPIAQLSHEWKETVIKPTCDEDGEKTQKCALCGTTEVLAHGYKTVNIDMGKIYTADKYDAAYSRTGHAYGEGVVVKAPNCSNAGVSKKTCANCGHSISEEIESASGAHSFYTPKVVKATCTTDGYKTQKCRYCNEVVTIETYDATGHTESLDYKVILEPGCEQGYSYVDEIDDSIAVVPAAYGVKAKYCTACGIILEDTITSEGDDMKPHSNHKIYLAETVEPGIGTKGKYTYKCEKCSYEKTIELDALEQFTVIFKDEKGNTIDKITKYKGETITIADPTKADSSDGKYRYVFDGWYTGKEVPKETLKLNSDAVIYDSTEYELPLEVSADLTLYAKFTAKEKLYTLKFVAATGYTENETDGFKHTYDESKYSELQGVIGDNRVPGFTPKLDGDHKYNFTFKEWNSKADGTGEKLSAIAVDKLGTADKTYYAQYNKEEVGYTVIFMENAKDAIYKAPEKVVDEETGEDITPIIPYGGSVSFVATDADGKDRTPVKAYDDEYHYTFNGKWYSDSACTIEASLTNITGNMVVYAGFDAEEHDLKATVTQKQDCEKAEITKYECKDENCGFAYTTETEPAAGHTEGEPVYDAETGENIYYCTVETCKKEIRREKASYSIKFVNYDGKTIKNLTAEANGEVKYDYNELGTPSRKADAENTYTFAGWVASSNNKKYAPDDKLPDAKADEIYTAYYTPTTRTYKVTFATQDNVAIKTFDVLYGGSVTYEYTEAEFGKSEATIDGHYDFVGWDKSTENITGDVLARPVFELNDHEYDGGKETGANCTTPGGMKYTCTVCGFYKMGTETVPETGHNLKLNENKSTEPDYATQTDGKMVYECQNPGCDYYEEVIISAKLGEIKVTVKDTAGNPIQNAQVQLFDKADGTQKGADRTGSSGVVTFWVKPGEYTVTVKVDGVGDTSYDVSVDENGNTTGNQSQVTINKPAEEEQKCECSCHRDNFWGGFFRFFQKIIKLFTGKASCCADPDSRI